MNQCMIPIAALLLFIIPAANAGGHRDGNSSDGVRVGEEIVMRDFVFKAKPVRVDDHMEYFRNVPGLEGLLEEVLRVAPGLGAKIFDQLARIQLWVTQESLALLPRSTTTVAGPDAEVQIALRFGDDVLVSEPALRKTTGDYSIFREALHGFVEGEGPIHHMKVANIISYLRENRGQLSAAGLSQVLKQNGVGQDILNDYWLERGHLLGELLYESQAGVACAIQSLIKGLRFGSEVRAGVLVWRPSLNECPPDSHLNYLEKTLPLMIQAMPEELHVDIPHIIEMNETYRPGFLSGAYLRELFREWCGKYASEELISTLRASISKLDIYEKRKVEVYVQMQEAWTRDPGFPTVMLAFRQNFIFTFDYALFKGRLPQVRSSWSVPESLALLKLEPMAVSTQTASVQQELRKKIAAVQKNQVICKK